LFEAKFVNKICKGYRLGLKLSMSKIPGYFLQSWLRCSSSKIRVFGAVMRASSDRVHHVIDYVT
jgi:hypothetical protein